MEADRPSRTLIAENRLKGGRIRPILAPMALGAVRRGVDEGAALLDRGLRERLTRRQEHTLLPRVEESITVPVAPLPAEADGELCAGGALYAEPIAEACERLAAQVRRTIERGELALVLGGDHALSIGSLAGAALASRRLGVIWIDAHADLNWPEVSPSGHIHGMPLGISLGRGPARLTGVGGTGPKLRSEDVYLFGIRDLDPAERAWLREGAIPHAPMAAIDADGFEAATHAMIARARASGVDALHVSFDLDALDPALMPGTGCREWGGFTFREAARLLRLLRDADLPICSLDWVELNPRLDPSGQSAAVAIELLAVALGEEPV